jgi:Translation initiation factor IF-2, N-terminal region
MGTGSKVRVYNLAKELKLDTKFIIEQLRREGADVEVPSNYISKELADKIRSKYAPKFDVPRNHSIRIIKPTDASTMKEKRPSLIQGEENENYLCTICKTFTCDNLPQIKKHKKFCKYESENKNKIEKPIPEKTFEKRNYVHLPIPQQARSKKRRCENCGDAFPMSQSNICYQCKDK